MAFVDVTVPYAAGGIQGGGVSAQFGGAPTGGGNPPGAVPMLTQQNGATGPGTNVPHRAWTIAFFLFIGLVLFWAGVIFNPKSGR